MQSVPAERPAASKQPKTVSLTQTLQNREQRTNNQRAKLSAFMATVRQCELGQEDADCTVFSDDDSDGDVINLFSHDLEKQELYDSSDEEEIEEGVNPIERRLPLSTLINQQDSDEEECIVQACSEKKHIWAQDAESTEKDLSTRLIEQFRELREQESELLKFVKSLCIGEDTKAWKDKIKAKGPKCGAQNR